MKLITCLLNKIPFAYIVEHTDAGMQCTDAGRGTRAFPTLKAALKFIMYNYNPLDQGLMLTRHFLGGKEQYIDLAPYHEHGGVTNEEAEREYSEALYKFRHTPPVKPNCTGLWCPDPGEKGKFILDYTLKHWKRRNWKRELL